MAGTISVQAQVEPNEMRFEYGVCTFTSTNATADVTILNPGWGAPNYIIGNPIGDCATNEEQLSIYGYSSGVVTIQRDGTSTLTDTGVINYLLIWKD